MSPLSACPHPLSPSPNWERGDFTSYSPPRGFTLVELLVVLAIVGLSASVVGLSVNALEPMPEAEIPRRLAEARSAAIRAGAPVTVGFAGGVEVTFRPDGSATPARVWDRVRYWRVDAWTGEARHE